MRQPISATREALRRLFFQRCFYLFVTLLALIALALGVYPQTHASRPVHAAADDVVAPNVGRSV